MSLGSWLNDRLEMRLDKRQNNTANRTAARSVAYANGIDPNAWIAQGVGSLSSAASNIFSPTGAISALRGGGVNAAGGLVVNDGSGKDNTILWLGAAALAAFFMFKR